MVTQKNILNALDLNQDYLITESSVFFESYLNKHSIYNYSNNQLCLSLSDDKFSKHLATNTFLNPKISKFNSISEAAKLLQNELKNWVLIPFSRHGKAKLIQDKLAKISFKKIKFLYTPPPTPLGHWLLLNENTLLFSSACTAKTPHGVYEFEEDKINPPSRAYLKLWELFTKLELIPDKNCTCIDLGSSPGGWTWVLSKLTKQVFSIDKAELILKKQNNVKFIKEDLLKLNWKPYLKEAQWIFCDAALSPEKLVPLFINIAEEDPHINFVCTLKQKGHELSKLTKEAANIKGTTLISLSNNKHELTWCRIKNNFKYLM